MGLLAALKETGSKVPNTDTQWSEEKPALRLNDPLSLRNMAWTHNPMRGAY
jgi:hypothetical protein